MTGTTCCLTFTGPSKIVEKVQKLLDKQPALMEDFKKTDSEPLNKKPKIAHNHDSLEDMAQLSENETWVTYQSHKLSNINKATIKNGERLTDKHITFCQTMLKTQFSLTERLECTLYQSKQRERKIHSGLQVIHVNCGDHWILASNLNTNANCLKIYASVFKSADNDLVTILKRLFEFNTYTFEKYQKQDGGSDCGLFAIAAAISILSGEDPSTCVFNQNCMRKNLITCIENQKFTSFPN